MHRNITNSTPAPSKSQAEPEDLSSPGSPASPSFPPSSVSPWPCTNKFLVFCDIVLKHTDYPHAFRNQNSDEEESSEEAKNAILVKNESRISSSPLNSVGESAVDSMRSGSSITESEVAELEPEEYDKEAYDSVSCWCGQPYAGRPMIECDRCLIWFHMACEDVEEGRVPELFHCLGCKSKKRKLRGSTSSRKGSKKRRRTSSAAPSAATSTSVVGASDAAPLLHMEQNGSDQMPSPLRHEGETTNHSVNYNGVDSSGLFPVQTPEPRPGTSRGSSPRSSKKRGRKRSANGVNGLTSILSGQLGLSVVDVGESVQSVPSSISQPPPLLPCYMVNDLPAATPETQRLENGHHAIVNGDSFDISSSQSFPSIPVLEPQVDSYQQSSYDLKNNPPLSAGGSNVHK